MTPRPSLPPVCKPAADWLGITAMMRRVGVDPALMEGPVYSEDCLYLNIWTDMDAEGKRPVLIFIHGGSNTGGWSYEPNYHGESLVKRDVVVVTVAYRLGVFGWLSHPEMEARNLALYDLAMSLEWVYQHIGKFGGDPNRITVSGESSGATNALHLAVSPLSRGRVGGLIHQSGGWPLDDTPDRNEATARGHRARTTCARWADGVGGPEAGPIGAHYGAGRRGLRRLSA